MRDGWHDISGYRVYVEGDRVLRGISSDSQKTIYPYRSSRYGGYDKDDGITVAAFRAGVRRDTIIMK